jgi:hypothetical protein
MYSVITWRVWLMFNANSYIGCAVVVAHTTSPERIEVGVDPTSRRPTSVRERCASILKSLCIWPAVRFGASRLDPTSLAVSNCLGASTGFRSMCTQWPIGVAKVKRVGPVSWLSIVHSSTRAVIGVKWNTHTRTPAHTREHTRAHAYARARTYAHARFVILSDPQCVKKSARNSPFFLYIGFWRRGRREQ